MDKVSECKLVYKQPRRSKPKVTNAREAYDICMAHWESDLEYVERFKILLLNSDNRCKGIFQVSQGALTSTPVDRRVVFTAALSGAAVAIILVHNHPSGNCKPSPADEKLTSELMKCGDLLDIKILDHIIISPSQFYSFTESVIIQV